MSEFARFADCLQDLRFFHQSLNPTCEAEWLSCDTYRSYDNAISNIVNPISESLRDLEAKIGAQGTIHN